MATRTQVSLDEYLATSFPELDREYVHGEIVERSMPIYIHGEIQAGFCGYFYPFRRSHAFFACTEVRMRAAQDVVRIPDMAVFAGERPLEPVPRTPPFIVAEILSPDDRWPDIKARLADFEAWGVPHLWVVDPQREQLLTYRNGVFTIVETFTLPGYPIEIRYSDLAG